MKALINTLTVIAFIAILVGLTACQESTPPEKPIEYPGGE